MKIKDLTNIKVNMLTVIKRIENENKRVCWLCKCDCGNYRKAISQNLIKKDIYSCGCTRRPMKKKSKYGDFNKHIYYSWHCIKRRCYDPKDKSYKNYGGRGIIMCDEWKNNFLSFHNWAINNGYKEGLTIDRINVNGNYEPNNCRWITRKENNSTKRNNIIVEYQGKKMCLKDYCKVKNICYSTALRKYKKGINIF